MVEFNDQGIEILATTAGANFCSGSVAQLDAYRWASVYAKVLPSLNKHNMDRILKALAVTPILVLNASRHHEILYEFSDGSVAYDDGIRMTVWDDATDLMYAYVDVLDASSILMPWLHIKCLVNLPDGYLDGVLGALEMSMKPLLAANKLNFEEPGWPRALPAE
mgnify:CR=1 FL=1